MTRDATKLVSMPIVDISEGRQLGRVKDAIFDPEAHELYGLLVTADVGGDCFLNREAIRGLGESAVTIDGEQAMTPIATETRARELMDAGIRLRGSKVVTEDGNSLGTLDKIMLEDDGRVACYESATGVLGLGQKYELAPSQVIKIGTDAIIVSASVASEADEGAAEPAPPVQASPATATQPGAAVPAPAAPTAQPGAAMAAPAAATTTEPGIAAPGTAAADMAVVQGVPTGTDPSKETLVAVPDSQPGNLIDEA